MIHNSEQGFEFPQLKSLLCAIIDYKHGIYEEFPHYLPNDLRLRTGKIRRMNIPYRMIAYFTVFLPN